MPIIRHPVPLEIVFEIFESVQSIRMCKVTEMEDLWFGEKDMGTKEDSGDVAPEFCVYFLSECVQFMLESFITISERTILIHLDFVGLSLCFRWRIYCLHILCPIGITDVTAG